MNITKGRLGQGGNMKNRKTWMGEVRLEKEKGTGRGGKYEKIRHIHSKTLTFFLFIIFPCSRQ